MFLYTKIAPELVFPPQAPELFAEASDRDFVQYRFRNGKAELVRLISTDPHRYLDAKAAPGCPVETLLGRKVEYQKTE